MKLAIHLFLGILFFTHALHSQNAAEDFKKINAAYEHTKKLSMSLVYSVYENYNSSKYIDRTEGSFKKDDKNYSSSLMGAHTIVNGTKMLTIHNDKKSITLSPAKPLNGPDISGYKLDEILKVYQKIIFVNKNEKEKAYIVYFKGDQNVLNRYEIHFNTDNYLISKIILFYNKTMEFSDDEKGTAQKPRMEIEFNNIDVKPDLNKDDFDLGKYLVFGDKTVLHSSYKNYHFIESKN